MIEKPWKGFTNEDNKTKQKNKNIQKKQKMCSRLGREMASLETLLNTVCIHFSESFSNNGQPCQQTSTVPQKKILICKCSESIPKSKPSILDP